MSSLLSPLALLPPTLLPRVSPAPALPPAAVTQSRGGGPTSAQQLPDRELYVTPNCIKQQRMQMGGRPKSITIVRYICINICFLIFISKYIHSQCSHLCVIGGHSPCHNIAVSFPESLHVFEVRMQFNSYMFYFIFNLLSQS